MNRVAPALLYGAYLVLMAVGPTLFGPNATVWIFTALSTGFILACAWLTKPRLYVPLVVVFFVTTVIPIAILVWLGLPVYGSVSAALAAFLSTLSEHGWLAGFEIVIPFFGAVAMAILVRSRYNIAMDRDAKRTHHL